ncbi:hypothetical protein Harman_14220 [Haloarcula mannanilytica]|uniref:Uncharacterized protein n=1 Tax=Haloarcula mannanilytica TaxID=2509225 RepID=A0A4C2EIH6_9EURY|nr:hypothetical protein [Haloarcula mannanilytica]GCF13487.1 hypothetical protein Harman_14220 [Haloarcula mannanilytica]
MTQSLLVYDGSTDLFRRAAETVTRCATDITPVPWESDAIQAFLRAQFDDPPFAFILIQGESVHVGETAVKEALDGLNVADPIARLVKQLYPTAAAPFGRVVHGQVPADIHGTFPLDEQAKAHIEPLRRVHTIPVEAE